MDREAAEAAGSYCRGCAGRKPVILLWMSPWVAWAGRQLNRDDARRAASDIRIIASRLAILVADRVRNDWEDGVYNGIRIQGVPKFNSLMTVPSWLSAPFTPSLSKPHAQVYLI
ncbi:uncharacterized protein MYCFIDRAFT_176209 [Pseudocercospora fijiensis CIRAD86]|uniref:Uncharacterized protein n=1 Tax=Pseudocercospora fijiensis (strain CIRAD86) TaxID=383855 RepID=M3A893_PSEFD|nr:uncharacterized protein MYCFIDRAFT_176209 [Pseudocercospora fijiensis CIRAD86]EME80826.1 hypothetical protein MYCFIDRAFT_176209 [Pseudocercospora fijiensis CIRAD86]